MVDEFTGCEICGDELCPGCATEVRVPRAVWIGLGALVLAALSVRGLEFLPERNNQGVVTPASTSMPRSDESTPTTMLSSSESETTSTSITTTSLLAVPVKVLGPLDHPLLDVKPAALWFWQPQCSLCQYQAEYLPNLLTRWSSIINFVSVPIRGDISERLSFFRQYGLSLPEIEDEDGELSTLFEITRTPTWGLVLPDGSYRTIEVGGGEAELEREFQALAKSVPMEVIDTSSEAAVRAAFAREFGPAAPELGWTGSTRSCNPGTTSRKHQEATLSRVNWYRAMAGVDPQVRLNDEFSFYAQAAALTMYASGRLSHEPDSTFDCMTEWSYEGASRSNLHFGFHGPEAINSYIEDEGSNNEEVGHRRWILLPELEEVGTGDTNRTNALLVLGGKRSKDTNTRERGLVMWPPRGFVPRSTIYRRWSVSAEKAFNGGAHVSVWSSGRVVVNDLIWPDDFVGWPTLVFSVPRSALQKGPIDVEIFQNVNGRPGELIVRYQVIPID